MAALGFNVCIVARNKDKIEKVLERIREKHKNIRTRAVVADFSSMFKI
jgi:short-subunit dehydrogenase